MLTRKVSVYRKVGGLLKYLHIRLQKRPVLMNVEVTKRCNARCDFCDYWKTTSRDELDDYLPVIQRLNPLVVSFTGGETLLRRDLPDIIRRVKENIKIVYVCMISHGAMLTIEKANRLWDAGLDQLSISLDFLGEKHDQSRGIPGLWKHLSEIIPQMVSMGYDNVLFNTFIMNDNLDQILDIARQADKWGIKVSFSTYSSVKVDNDGHMITGDRIDKLEEVIEGLISMKRERKNILTSDFYLRNVPKYFRNNGHLGDCQAGRRFIQVTPNGMLKPCSELDPVMHYTEYNSQWDHVDCDVCWFSCRGESQVPFSLNRIKELVLR